MDDKFTDSMLLKAKEMASLQRPSARDWRSVRKWLLEKAPLVKREQEFILRREDIITLRSGREGAGFEALVEQMVGKADRFLQRFGCKAIQVSKKEECTFWRFHLGLTLVAVFVRDARAPRENVGCHAGLLRPKAH